MTSIAELAAAPAIHRFLAMTRQLQGPCQGIAPGRRDLFTVAGDSQGMIGRANAPIRHSGVLA
ncbi:hypothetical protein ABK905_22410 [Acerihabitans sp. KWT182]|uniref:Uncharacterized protein n=1 Tax=Acerihabitans sp. KWT182 TaxID=3157919 RepID=A0AAU7Q7Q9_9GAMM